MGAVVLQQAVSTTTPSWLEVGSDLLRTTFALGAVCLLAWVVLRALSARGIGRFGNGNRRGNKRIEVMDRVALDGQRALYVVKVEQRRLLIGTGPGAAPSMLAELEGSPASLGSSSGLTDEELMAAHEAPRRDATH